MTTTAYNNSGNKSIYKKLNRYSISIVVFNVPLDAQTILPANHLTGAKKTIFLTNHLTGAEII